MVDQFHDLSVSLGKYYTKSPFADVFSLATHLGGYHQVFVIK